MSRRAGLVVAAALLVLCPSAARAAEQADRSTLESYADWAQGALEALPQQVQLLEPLAQQLVELTAERRREAGLGSLAADPELLPAARAHALDVLERGYAGHVTPGGLDPSDRVALLHRRLVGSVGENLAELTGLGVEQREGQTGPLAAKIMAGWMESPEHRDNILGRHHTHLAIAAVAQGEKVVIVQLFAARRALLVEPLPWHAGRNGTLPLRFEQGQDLAVPAQYAYARPGQPAQDLITLDLSNNEIPVEPGAYFLRFLFPSGAAGHLEVVAGPAILVRQAFR